MNRFRAVTLVVVFGFIPAIAHLGWCQTTRTEHAPADNSAGAQSYAKNCAICHGDQREGILPGFPPLLDVNRKFTPQQIESLIRTGKGRMPNFAKLSQEEVAELMRFLSTSDNAVGGANGAGNISDAGRPLFQRNCAFCHGRDAAGGETGPDLTRSKLLISDTNGSKFSEVVRNGRPEKKRPAFNFSNEEVHSLLLFVRNQGKSSRPGGRRGVDVSDLPSTLLGL